MGSDADGESLDCAALDLAERRQIALDVAAVNDAARLDQTEGDAARQAFERAVLDGLLEAAQIAQRPARLRSQPGFDAPLGPVTRGLGTKVADQSHARRKGLGVGDLCGQGAGPENVALWRDAKGFVAVGGETAQAAIDLWRHGLDRGGFQGAVGKRGAAAFDREPHALQMADGLAIHGDHAVAADLGQGVGAVVKRAHQRGGLAIHKAGGQPLVQDVGKAVLQRACALAPSLGLIQPVRPGGDVAQRPHPREPRRKLVDLPIVAVEFGEARRDPVVGQATSLTAQGLEDVARQPGVLVQRRLLEVGQLATFPQPHDRPARAADLLDLVVLHGPAQQGLVQRRHGQLEARPVRRLDQGAQQVRQGVEVEAGVPPLGVLDGIELVVDHLLDQVLVQFVALARHAKGAVADVSPRPAGDLGDLVGVEPAGTSAVELPHASEGDMVDVHVQAHADGVGGDQEVHLSRLEQGHLGVAGAGAERAHDDGGAAPLPTDQLGDGVDLLGREGDDRRAARQARQLL